ncbi:MDS1 and EVI1 complex locus protein MDS1 [Elysia marginata]|uniref:MDS1 and EVI1 complex locus protein MDS1 n=1 Tax=Elysia marginata TaxID=1093978 RepID=A0AAV4HYX6_9GAST|nr:MDS1 and EVI1 complex locus protein MDS1 [Elysia marginata]
MALGRYRTRRMEVDGIGLGRVGNRDAPTPCLTENAHGNHIDKDENISDCRPGDKDNPDISMNVFKPVPQTTLFSPTLTSLLTSSKCPAPAPTFSSPSSTSASSLRSATSESSASAPTMTATKGRLSLQDLFPGRRNLVDLHSQSMQYLPGEQRLPHHHHHHQQQQQQQCQQEQQQDIATGNIKEDGPIDLHKAQANQDSQEPVGVEPTKKDSLQPTSNTLLALQLQQASGALGDHFTNHLQPSPSHLQPSPSHLQPQLLSSIKVDLEQHQHLTSQLYLKQQKQQQQQQQQIQLQQSQQQQEHHLNLPLRLSRQHQFLTNHFFTLLEDLPVPEVFLLRPSQVYPGMGVWSKGHISAGQKFGPFQGVLKPSVEDTSCAWEVSRTSRDEWVNNVNKIEGRCKE